MKTKKVTIIKKATKDAKPQGFCPIYVDDFPEGGSPSK
jgi:hypothetical protein